MPVTDDALASRLRRHVGHLAGEIGERNVFRPGALRAAQAYIEDIWAGQGYEVAAQPCPVGGVDSANLSVICPGSDWPRQFIVIGAHYDSVQGSPGADDNASAVAALLELSDLMKGRTLGCSVRLVAFTNEEPPFFFTHRQGSRVFAGSARRRGEFIRMMVSLEMLGYYRDTPGSQRYPPLFRFFFPDRGDFIALVSNFRSRREMRGFAAAFRGASDFPLQQVAAWAAIPGVAWSDHLSFWINRYRAFMVTDTAFYRNPFYHTSRDTPDTLDYDRLARLTLALARTTATVTHAEYR